MAKQDNMDAAKLELIADLLHTQANQQKGPNDLSENKPTKYTHRSAFKKSENTRAKREKAGQAELRKAMRKPRTEPLGGPTK